MGVVCGCFVSISSCLKGECSIYWGDGALWGLLAPILANYHY